MKKTLAALALAVALPVLASCTPCLDRAAPGVRMHGTPAAGADAILASALARYPDLRGDVNWIEPGASPMYCGARVAGCVYVRPECGDFTAVVERIEPATASALAHELCHAAGVAEAEAPRCAQQVIP